MAEEFPREWTRKEIIDIALSVSPIREKPPLGLIPEKIHEEVSNKTRIEEIINAMTRYSEKDKPIPLEWISELYGRIKRGNR